MNGLRWPGLISFVMSLRLLNLLEPASAIFGGVAPGVRRRAHEGACWRAVAEVDPLHRDDLVDDAGQLAASLASLDLRLPSCDVEIVDEPREALVRSENFHRS